MKVCRLPKVARGSKGHELNHLIYIYIYVFFYLYIYIYTKPGSPKVPFIILLGIYIESTIPGDYSLVLFDLQGILSNSIH